MPTWKNFEELEAWQKARELAREIYTLSRQEPFSRDFGLCDQIRRASVSVMSNIAEGFERSGNGEFLQFLAIAKGSAGEVKSQLYVALDQGYIIKEQFDKVYCLAAEITRLIAGLMNYLRNSGIKGTKFKK